MDLEVSIVGDSAILVVSSIDVPYFDRVLDRDIGYLESFEQLLANEVVSCSRVS